MALTPGARIGAYEITSAIGAGGMGEVYRARDSKLKRDVALKVLPPEMLASYERLARFQREAEVLASLNHPSPDSESSMLTVVLNWQSRLPSVGR